jgi:hypothetical protein
MSSICALSLVSLLFLHLPIHIYMYEKARQARRQFFRDGNNLLACASTFASLLSFVWAYYDGCFEV